MTINLDKYDGRYVSILLESGHHVHGRLNANKTSDGPYRDTHTSGYTLEVAIMYHLDQEFLYQSDSYPIDKKEENLSVYEVTPEYISLVRDITDLVEFEQTFFNTEKMKNKNRK